tara:strand:+ start:131 stop:436 length:306 start_codon:yes stop_codon:yes gene_type:complete
MQKYLSVLVKNEQRQLIGVSEVVLIEQASTSKVEVIYSSGKKVEINHDTMAANDEQIRDAVEDALVAALQTSWTKVSHELSLTGINNAAGAQVEVTSLSFT